MAVDTLVIVPAFDEGRSIGAVLAELAPYRDTFDVIVVDDGSRDATGNVARAAGVTVLRLPLNMGNGVAVQTGLKYAVRRGYRFAAQFDADGQHRVDGLLRLVAAACAGEGDVVVGSRFMDERSFSPSLPRRLGIRLFSALLRWTTHITVRDITSGLRVFNQRAMHVLARDYPDHFPDADVLLLLAMAGCSIRELPVSMRARLAGRSKTGLTRSVYYPFRVSLGMLMVLFRTRA